MSGPLNPEREQHIRYAVAAYTEGHSDLGFACCSAHGAADGTVELLAELDRVRAERDQYCDRVDTLTAVAKGNKRHVQEMFADLQTAQGERDEAFRCRDAALRALQRDDVDTDVHLPDLLADGLHGIAEWDNEPPDQAPDWLINAVVGLVRPVLAKLTAERDQARRDSAHWQYELQLADARIAELRAVTEAGEAR